MCVYALLSGSYSFELRGGSKREREREREREMEGGQR